MLPKKSDSANAPHHAPDHSLDVLARHAIRNGRRFTICRLFCDDYDLWESFWDQPTDPDIRRPLEGFEPLIVLGLKSP